MENTFVQNKREVSTNMLLFFLFLLVLEDYFLTYIGIYNFKIIEEANPLMFGLMTLPLSYGVMLKIIVALIPIFLLKFVERYMNPISFRRILLVPIVLQIIPYTAHAIWIYKYFRVI